MSQRQILINAIHNTIINNSIPTSDIVLALAQIMTDISLTLWNHRPESVNQTNKITPQLLKVMETEHYQKPMLDTALSLTASQMICWVHDDEQVKNEH